MSVHAASDGASCPLDWRLFIPVGWDPTTAEDADVSAAITARRVRAGIPDTEGHRPKWELALEMLDELTGWGLTPPVVAADAGYGTNADFRAGINDRGWHYVVQVEDELTAHGGDAVPEELPYCGRGPRPKPRYRTTAVSLHEHALAAGRGGTREVTWRQGSRAAPTSTFLAVRVPPAGRRVTGRLAGDGSLPEAWLLADWPQGADEPVKYRPSNLPETTPLADLVRLAKIRWRISRDYRELKTGLGLDHFEGRTWRGWHRHVTLVSAAQLFLTVLRADPKAARTA